MIFRLGFLSLAAWASIKTASAVDLIEHLRKTSLEEVGIADTQAIFKKVELGQKYVAALDNLEKTFAAAGQLDAIVNLRAEREEVRKTGGTTNHQDKALVELRAKYLKSLEGIEAEAKAAKETVVEGITKKIRDQETALTKAGKVEDALNLRKQGEDLMLEISGGAAAAAVDFKEDPRVGVKPDLNPLQPIDVPDGKPAPFDDPFSIKGRWMESMTIPVAKQRIREPVVIGDRGKKIWPLIVVSPGSIWSGDDLGRIELSASNFIAEKCRFQDIELGADHACFYFFRNSSFADCRFAKVGIWYGGDQAAKYFFENCVIRDKFSGTLNIVDIGLRMQSCVLEGIKLPTMRYRKHQPAGFVNHKWMRIMHSRFVKCEIPLSFLLLTRECVFENCVFVDDDDRGDDAEITKPVEVVMYTSTCQMKIRKLPPVVTLTQKQLNEIKGITIPTAASLEAMR